MTIPSTYKRNTVGGAFTEQKIGGVVIGITSATTTTDGSPVTEVSLLKDQGIDGVDRRTAPKDTASTVEALAATGTFAYDQSAWILIGNQANNKINNSASTALVLNGNDSSTDNERSSLTPIGAKTSTAWRNGSFEYLGVSAQRTPWGSGTPDPMNAANYQDAVGGVTTVDDAVGTQAVPGELAFMYGALVANTGEYSERTGG
ncbi:MAG: hypothetical protein DWQ49_15715 [Bacteroidetes bacterium]|nr:MAG: hypothetical protein DWQ49_15715 [Bacteroidota bacterium]